MYDEEPGGCHPGLLPEVAGPQARVLQRTVEPFVETFVPVPILDLPVPQVVDQLVDVLKIFHTMLPVVGQVVEVPKIILQDSIPQLIALRDPQLVEQLVAVSTVPFFVEQTFDIPVLGGGGRRGSKRRTRLWPKLVRRPGQGSTAFGGAEH